LSLRRLIRRDLVHRLIVESCSFWGLFVDLSFQSPYIGLNVRLKVE
jgi:hypothetical protein